MTVAPHALPMFASARIASLAFLLLTSCPGIDLRPRYLKDPAFSEADAGERRGDRDDRWALARLSRVAGFPAVGDPDVAARDAELARATVAAAAAIASPRVPGSGGAYVDLELRDAAYLVLRRRRPAALRAIARALDDPMPTRRSAALALVNDLYFPCRPQDAGRSACQAWPERAELLAAMARIARSDPDPGVRSEAVQRIRYDVSDAVGPAWEPIVAAIDQEPVGDVRAGWFDLLERRTLPPAPIGIELARRVAPSGIRVREFLGRYLAESNRTLLERAYVQGDALLRRDLGSAIFDAETSLPWTVALVEQGLFDADADVRACFAGSVTALDPVPRPIRDRLTSTAAEWESSRTALSFLRAKDEGRPFR